jgi:SOS-response transcriptional repressor LexA
MPRQSLYQFKRDGILDAISTLSAATGKAPSIREIAQVADVSIATLHCYLTKMKDEGVISWTERHHRSLKVLETGNSLATQ